ncbi:hypothetical protein [Candidatus Nitrosoglobus terrae]|nr:hypothetical protein [Candidatus Nitrosoglobus terrae]
MKIITLAFMLTALYSASPLVLAHTTIKDQAQEGVDLYTADVIAHGCVSGVKPFLPVIAESLAFPNGPNDIYTRADTGAAISLGDVLVGADISHGVIDPTALQYRDVFDKTALMTDNSMSNELADDAPISGVIRGIHYTNSDNDRQGTNEQLQVDLQGVIPFKFPGVEFVSSSCATQLNVQIAIADWCTQEGGSRRANVWIGKATPMFPASGPAGEAIAANFWPVLIVNRNLTTNPLPSNCGKGFTAIAEPSADTIDQFLPIPGFQP